MVLLRINRFVIVKCFSILKKQYLVPNKFRQIKEIFCWGRFNKVQDVPRALKMFDRISDFILFDQEVEKKSFVLTNPNEVIVAQEPSEVSKAFEAMESARLRGAWLAGFASYELGYFLEPRLTSLMPLNRATPLLCFGVFDPPDSTELTYLLKRGRLDKKQVKLAQPDPLWSWENYRSAFRKIKHYIRSGDIYQANLTFPMKVSYEGTPLGLYLALKSIQPVPHGALVHLGGNVLLSRSPELFFQIDRNRVIQTRPMKGTLARSTASLSDDDSIDFLTHDQKNQAENLMIVDVLRNDMSQIAQMGTVEVPYLFAVESYRTVYQMTSLVQAQLKKPLSLFALFRALFPSGSVTGAPKIRAMEIIRELESEARNSYCGTIGWFAPDGRASFNVAIRTLRLLDHRNALLNVGSGVVEDSTPSSEYQESLWKARYTNLSLKD